LSPQWPGSQNIFNAALHQDAEVCLVMVKMLISLVMGCPCWTVSTTTFRQNTKFGLSYLESSCAVHKCWLNWILLFWHKSIFANFPAYDLTVLLRAGMLSLLCGMGNLNKCWYACEPHEIQYTKWRINKYMYNFICVSVYTSFATKYTDNKWEKLIDKYSSKNMLGYHYM